MATYYLNNAGVTGAWSAGDDTNAGTSRTVPKLTWQGIDNLGLVAGTDDFILYSDGATTYTLPNSVEEILLNAGEHVVDYNASGNYVITTNDGSGGSGRPVSSIVGSI